MAYIRIDWGKKNIPLESTGKNKQPNCSQVPPAKSGIAMLVLKYSHVTEFTAMQEPSP